MSDRSSPSIGGLASARSLVMEVLGRERTVEEEPWLLEDDLLYFAARTLSQEDPGWILRRLLDRELEYDARVLILTQLPGPPRQIAAKFLRAENPEHVAWQSAKALWSSPELRPDGADNPQTATRVADLDNPKPEVRDRAVEELGDLVADPDLPLPFFREATEALLRAALTESEPVVLESILNALSAAANARDRGRIDLVDWSPLAALLEDVDSRYLEYVLEALGATGDARYRVAVLRLADHSSPVVRASAESALLHIDSATSDDSKTSS